MRVVLPRGGLGICNAVYVDDVVSALMLAADCVAAVGESFLVSGASSVTWREFYGAYEKMLGRTAVVDPGEAQLGIVESSWQRPPHSSSVGRLKAGVRRLLPGPVKATIKKGLRLFQGRQAAVSDAETPFFVPDGLLHALYASKTHIRIDKARRILGYKPTFDLDEGWHVPPNGLARRICLHARQWHPGPRVRRKLSLCESADGASDDDGRYLGGALVNSIVTPMAAGAFFFHDDDRMGGLRKTVVASSGAFLVGGRT